MNGRLSTWLLLGVLVVWPLAVYGQRSKPPIEQRTILNLIPGEDLSSRETSRGTARVNDFETGVREI
jgi:hypothetical protein